MKKFGDIEKSMDPITNDTNPGVNSIADEKLITPLCKWLNISGPLLYDKNEYDDIVVDGVRWGDLKASVKKDEADPRTDKEKRVDEEIKKRLENHFKEIESGTIIKHNEVKPV